MTPDTLGPDPPLTYEFRIKGRLDARWAGWFDDQELVHDGSSTILRCPVADQAALHGLLARVRDLGLTLLSMHTVEQHHGTETEDSAWPFKDA